MPERKHTGSDRDIVTTRIRNARAVLVAMMNTWNDDMTETTLPMAWIHEGLEAAKEMLDDADDADARAYRTENAKNAPGAIA